METNRITQQRIHWNAAQDKTMFLRLPLKERERRWLTEQLEVLSVKEQYQLAAAIRNTEQLKELAGKTGLELSAAILSRRPEVAVEAINCFLNLHDYEVCFPAGSYEELGRYHLTYESGAVDDVRPFLDMEQLGRRCAELHPGCFLDDCYVRHPQREMQPIYDGQTLPAAEVMDWSLRLKLASPAVPEGVWLRLPDDAEVLDFRPDEIDMAFHALQASSIRECTLLDVRCILPEIRNLMDEYDNLEDLVRDGNNLGYLLEEQGQGMPHFLERFRGALALEQCESLSMALDIGQNLRGYDFVPQKDIEAVSREATSEDPLVSECLDHAAYGAYLLEQQGYQQTGSGAYIRRNEQLLQWEHSPAPMEMTTL